MVSLYGASQVELDFNMEYFIPSDSLLKGFVELDIDHFQTGYTVGIFS